MAVDNSAPNYGYGAPPQFPNPAFGLPTPRPEQWGAYFPDLRAREQQYAGNSAFATPGLPNLGNPMLNTIAGMGLNMLTGGNVRAIGGTDLPDMDYFRAQERTNQRLAHYPSVIANSPGLSDWGELGKSPTFQMAYDQLLTPGGSSAQAYETILGRYDKDFTGTQKERGDTAERMQKQIANEFATYDTKTGASRYDYAKSFGYKQDETIQNIDSLSRFGAAGFTHDEIETQIKGGRMGTLATKANAISRMTSQTFGSDMSVDARNDLLDKAVGGMAGITQDKATDFLAKVQSTSRALDVSSKAFAEYLAMQQGLYKQMGLGGQVATDAAMQSATSGKVLANQAQKNLNDGNSGQNMNLANQSHAVEVSAKIQAQFSGSALAKKALAIGGFRSNMTDAQGAAALSDGQTFDQHMQLLQEAVRNGDDKAMRKEEAILSTSGNFTSSDVNRGAATMNATRAAMGSKWIDVGSSDMTSADRKAHRIATNLMSNATNVDKAQLAKLGGKDGLAKLFADTDSAGMRDKSTIRKLLDDDGRIAEGDRDAVASQLAIAGDLATSNGRAYRHQGLKDQDSIDAAISRGSGKAARETRANREKQAKEADVAVMLNPIMGAITKKLDSPEAIAEALKGWNESTGTNKERIEKTLKGMPEKLAKSAEIKKLKAAMEDGSLDKISADATAASDAELKAGGSREKAAKVHAEVLRKGIKDLGLGTVTAKEMEDAEKEAAEAQKKAAAEKDGKDGKDKDGKDKDGSKVDEKAIGSVLSLLTGISGYLEKLVKQGEEPDNYVMDDSRKKGD